MFPDVAASLSHWFNEFAACVRAVDFARAEALFVEDVMGFGTFKEIVLGRDELRREQWSNVWPNVRDFTFRLDRMHWGVDGALAWAACPWTSVGFDADGAPFDRPGRVTVVFQRRPAGWLAVHTHFSLYPRHASNP